jgi:hypothetical protein
MKTEGGGESGSILINYLVGKCTFPALKGTLTKGAKNV